MLQLNDQLRNLVSGAIRSSYESDWAMGRHVSPTCRGLLWLRDASGIRRRCWIRWRRCHVRREWASERMRRDGVCRRIYAR